MEINESSCLHVRDFDFHTLGPNRAPPPHMSIFSLVKGEKEHEVFEMRMWRRGILNSYNIIKKAAPQIFKVLLFILSILPPKYVSHFPRAPRSGDQFLLIYKGFRDFPI